MTAARRSRAAVAGGIVALLAALAAPSPAPAHGLVQRADLPIPEWLFGWAAAVVLVVSFVALAVLWQEPKLENREDTAGGDGTALGRALASRPVELLAGAVGVALLGIVLWSGLAGTESPEANFAPTFVFVIFWVGLVVASVLLGDVFRALNPWRAIGRATGWLVTRARGGRPPSHAPYPERLGRWPAAAGIFAFTALELVIIEGSEPRTVAWATIVYTVVTLAAMARYGTEPWVRSGEAFGVYFGLFARIAPLHVRDGAVRGRPPLSGLTSVRELPGTVALLMVAIGTVSFDGLSGGTLWGDTVQPELFSLFDGLGESAAEQLAALIGMLACVGIVALFYRLGVAGARSVGGDLDAQRLRRAFVHSLVPIAVVYVLAHYLTFLVFNGQSIAYLASDPLGEGWNLFGTASAAIDYSVLSQNAAWYLQVGFVVLGHVAALALAHDRALVLYPHSRLAVRSQYWMLGVMVGFTSLALWLLAQAGG